MEINTTKEYVVLRHLTMPYKGLCFFTRNSEIGRDCKGFNGETWYEIVGYANSIQEAQTLVVKNYGGSPTAKEFEEHVRKERSV